MAEQFVARLSEKIKSHEQFWNDLGSLQASAVWFLSVGFGPPKGLWDSDAASLGRLMYSGSIFSQATDEQTKALAQSIALCALITNPEPNIVARSKSILAGIGNYPALSYLERQFNETPSTLLAILRTELLKLINSIVIEGKEVPLTEFQYDLWKTLPVAASTAVSAPTSAGKSFLVIEYLCRRAQKDEKFTGVFIAPTRALLSEVQHKIEKRLAGTADLRVSTVPAPDIQGRNRQIFVLTQERLHVLLSISTVVVDVVVVDEAQGLADGPRGMILQDCLERLRMDSPNLQTILLAPGAEGFASVADFLGIPGLVIKETDLSPVQQNRVQVAVKAGRPKELHLSLLTATGAKGIGILSTQRGVVNRSTRLTVAALELGKTGASLVYATGPADAEKIADQFAADTLIIKSEQLVQLSNFIKEHIHPEYELGAMVLHGVAFHYGHMPTLLREALEEAFRGGGLHYLVCTTTLFQGVNLPARNVFINTPTRGRGTPLDSAHLWNFAGRAGRLGQEFAGNVFLVDYEDWTTQSMHERSKFRIVPAFAETISNDFDAVLGALGGEMPKPRLNDPRPAEVRAAAGLILARASTNRMAGLLNRIPNLSQVQRQSIQIQAEKALHELKLPKSLIEANWTVDPFGLRRLADRMAEKIKSGELEDLIPVHPDDPRAFKRYASIITRALRELLRIETKQYGGLVATYAVPWMQGAPYPALLRKWVGYKRKQNPKSQLSVAIRTGFEFFEQVLRFQMVQVGKAYLDVLDYVLEIHNLSERRREAFNFSLALELGVSSTTGRSFIELGVSRIVATVLEALFPDSELTPQEAKQKLLDLDTSAVTLSPVIMSELRRLDLIPAQNSN
jgi:hypothetical protein